MKRGDPEPGYWPKPGDGSAPARSKPGGTGHQPAERSKNCTEKEAASKRVKHQLAVVGDEPRQCDNRSRREQGNCKTSEAAVRPILDIAAKNGSGTLGDCGRKWTPGRSDRHQHSEQRRQEQRGGLHRAIGLDREQPLGCLADQCRGDRTDRQSNEDRDHREHCDRNPEHCAKVAAAGAVDLEDRNRLLAGSGKGRRRARDPDTSDAERAERDQQQQLADPVDKPAGSGGGIALVERTPATVGEAALKPGPCGETVNRWRKQDPIAGGIEAARLNEAGRLQSLGSDQNGRCKGEAVGGGKLADDPADPEAGKADRHRRAGSKSEPVGDLTSNRRLTRTGHPARCKLDLSGRRPAGGGAGQFDQRAGAVAGLEVRAQGRARRDGSERAHRGEFGGGRCALGGRKHEISTEQGTAVLGDGRADRGGHTGDRGEPADRDGQADQQQPEPADPTAQVAPGKRPSAHGATQPLMMLRCARRRSERSARRARRLRDRG